MQNDVTITRIPKCIPYFGFIFGYNNTTIIESMMKIRPSYSEIINWHILCSTAKLYLVRPEMVGRSR